MPLRIAVLHWEMSLGIRGHDREVCRAQRLFCLGALEQLVSCSQLQVTSSIEPDRALVQRPPSQDPGTDLLGTSESAV
jgi:hypothetical protein